MGIIKTIQRSRSDFLKPKQKSYRDLDLKVKLMKIGSITEKKNPSVTEERALLFELSGNESIEEVIVLDNANPRFGKVTVFQMKEILNDMGFNIDPWLSGKHKADFEAVMNINGYSIPGWVKIARVVARFFPSHEKALLLKLSPGRDRLHLSAFENTDGSWIITAHTDYNWLNLNLVRVLKSHIGHGAGDFITGTLMACDLFDSFSEHIKENKILTSGEINKILVGGYNKSLVKKFHINSSKNLAIL
jgi:hypothetical protein